MLNLNDQNYITNWLISGPVCKDFTVPSGIDAANLNKLEYEKQLRANFYEDTQCDKKEDIQLDAISINSAKWEYHYDRDNWFIDKSAFYSLLTHISLNAYTNVVSQKKQKIKATIYTYAAFEIFVNGECVLKNKKAVYKPINKFDIELDLKEGANDIYVKIQCIGIRDTRVIFGMKLEEKSTVGIDLPIQNNLIDVAEYLTKLAFDKGIKYKKIADVEMFYSLDGDKKIPFTEDLIDISAKVITVSAKIGTQILNKTLHLPQNLKPLYQNDTAENIYQNMYQEIAKRVPEGSNAKDMAILNVLAKYYLGTNTKQDDDAIMRDLANVEKCIDCADFRVLGIITLIKNYNVSNQLSTRIREVMLGFRYFMDEPGDDGMCFWSENHALMFYAAQMIFGEYYKNEVFVSSQKTGSQQYEIGLRRCHEWMDEVLENGLEEFNSATYLPLTLGAMLTVHDYAEESLKQKAKKAIDMLLEQLCKHVFDGSCISPQGRVYRTVISPYIQTVQSILHLINPEYPAEVQNSKWNIFFATSKYKMPKHLAKLASENFNGNYISGNARINICKTNKYMLTSVQSPRLDEQNIDWVNVFHDENANKDSNLFVKSLNERFHGTSVFQSGIFGYQQHAWYAALSSEAILFVNHPGSSVDLDEMRPGYWYGNGIFPALLQKNNHLGAIYKIPEDYPITFTHLYLPKVKFEKVTKHSNWLIASTNGGYIGVWCNCELEEHNDALTDCEWRCYETEAAYYVICESIENFNTSDEFLKYCEKINPVFNQNKLTTSDNFMLQYKEHINETQYIP